MTDQEKKIAEWSDKILQFLLDKRKDNPDLKFWMRKKAKSDNRLNNGMWFNCTDKYVAVGFTKRDAGNLSTRSINFFVRFDKNNHPSSSIVLIFKNESDKQSLKLYDRIMDSIGGFEKIKEFNYKKVFESEDVIGNLNTFLNIHLPVINNIIKEEHLEDKFIQSDEDFNKSLDYILKKRTDIKNMDTEFKCIIVNITWNSNDWKSPSEDKSTHKYVVEGGLPSESWNFDFDNPRNPKERIYGFAQFRNSPKISGQNNLIVFYSNGKIVGFYGKADVFENVPVDDANDVNYNISGDKNFSLVLNNKIDKIKKKGYLEDKVRVGQIGFNYLNNIQTSINILNEAMLLNPEQEEKLKKIKEWLESQPITPIDEKWIELAKIIKKINNPKAVRIFFQLVKEILKEHNLDIDDERFYCAVRPDKNRLHLTLGSRYAAMVQKIASDTIIGFYASKEDKERIEAEYKEIHKLDYFESRGEVLGIWAEVSYEEMNPDTWSKSIIEATKKELLQSKSQFRERGLHNPWIYKAAFSQDLLNKLFNNSKEIIEDKIDVNMSNIPQNQIFYGPPGTGKTYNLVNKAISIINPEFELNQDREEIKAEYDRLEKENRILFTTFHQSLSYEDFIEGIKPLPPLPNEPLKYEIQPGIFKIACARAAYLCHKKYNELKGLPDSAYSFDELYYAFIDSIRPLLNDDNYPIYKTITGKEVEIYQINTQDSIKARAKGSKDLHAAPLTQANLEKMYNKFDRIEEIESLDQVRGAVQVSPRITEFYAIFRGIKDFEKTFNPDNKIEEEEIKIDTISDEDKIKKFSDGIYNEAIIKNIKNNKVAEPVVLIIDEINRGNVSQIFGELITLLEEDKRLGNSESLEITLPYSKSKFSVPPNLYLIGTMNTADRSIEALDTALRRRFDFIEMLPEPKVITEKGDDFVKLDNYNVDLVKLLETINGRIEVLLDRDHLIGHSYFLNIKTEKDLKMTFKRNIIPLLQEYFYGDYGKISLVLGEGFCKGENNEKKIKFANANGYDTSPFEEKTIYRIANIDKDFSVKSAIQLLLNETSPSEES